MIDSIARWIGEIVNLVRTAPTQHVRRDHVKSFCQRGDVVLPGYFRRGPILPAVKQDELRTLACFEEVSFDVADEQGSVMVSRHGSKVAKL